MKTISGTWKRTGFALLALSFARSSEVQAQAPARAAILPAPQLQIAITLSASGILLDAKASNINVKELLRAIANKANVTVVISDDVPPAVVKSWEVHKCSPRSAIDSIAWTSGLGFGYVGNNTFLIVRGTQPSMQQRVIVREWKRPINPLNPGPNHPGTPFLFNGQLVYNIPLTNSDAQPAAKTQR